MRCALVLEQAREIDAMKAFQAEVERLKAIIEALQRHRFGRRSEQLDPDQLELCLEEVKAALAQAEHARDKASHTTDRPRKANRGSLPAHLERIEQVVDIDDKACPCCGGVLHQIGEDIAERLDVVPAIECCKLNGIDPYALLTSTPTRLAAGHPANAVKDLMPWTAVT